MEWMCYAFVQRGVLGKISTLRQVHRSKGRVAEALEIFRVAKCAPSGPVISEQSVKKCEG